MTDVKIIKDNFVPVTSNCRLLVCLQAGLAHEIGFINRARGGRGFATLEQLKRVTNLICARPRLFNGVDIYSLQEKTSQLEKRNASAILEDFGCLKTSDEKRRPFLYILFQHTNFVSIFLCDFASVLHCVFCCFSYFFQFSFLHFSSSFFRFYYLFIFTFSSVDF